MNILLNFLTDNYLLIGVIGGLILAPFMMRRDGEPFVSASVFVVLIAPIVLFCTIVYGGYFMANREREVTSAEVKRVYGYERVTSTVYQTPEGDRVECKVTSSNSEIILICDGKEPPRLTS